MIQWAITVLSKWTKTAHYSNWYRQGQWSYCTNFFHRHFCNLAIYRQLLCKRLLIEEQTLMARTPSKLHRNCSSALDIFIHPFLSIVTQHFVIKCSEWCLKWQIPFWRRPNNSNPRTRQIFGMLYKNVLFLVEKLLDHFLKVQIFFLQPFWIGCWNFVKILTHLLKNKIGLTLDTLSKKIHSWKNILLWIWCA